MSTVTYGVYAPTAPEAAKAAPQALWRRVVNALIRAQERRANREIARYLANHGGLLTDGMEREIMRQVIYNQSRIV